MKVIAGNLRVIFQRLGQDTNAHADQVATALIRMPVSPGFFASITAARGDGHDVGLLIRKEPRVRNLRSAVLIEGGYQEPLRFAGAQEHGGGTPQVAHFGIALLVFGP